MPVPTLPVVVRAPARIEGDDAAAFVTALRRAAADGRGAVVVDLARTVALARPALAALLATRHYVEARGGAFAVTGARPDVARVLELAGHVAPGAP